MNGLARAIFFGKQGELRERTIQHQLHVDVKSILTLFARLPFTLLPKIMISGSSSDDCRHHYV